MLKQTLSRLGLVNDQFGEKYCIKYLKRIEGSASVDFDSELKGTLKVKDFYRGKNIFITGCTGFLAKVILEKLFRTCPDIGKIYIMVRPKRKVTPMARIEKEILTSQCFDKLVESMGQKEFQAFARSKIIPIQGDLIVEGLGMSPEDHELIINETDIFINSAASVNFDDPLKDALNINYFGAQRMLNLAK